MLCTGTQTQGLGHTTWNAPPLSYFPALILSFFRLIKAPQLYFRQCCTEETSLMNYVRQQQTIYTHTPMWERPMPAQDSEFWTTPCQPGRSNVTLQSFKAKEFLKISQIPEDEREASIFLPLCPCSVSVSFTGYKAYGETVTTLPGILPYLYIVCARICQDTKVGFRSPAAAITGGCEPPSIMGVGNHPQGSAGTVCTLNFGATSPASYALWAFPQFKKKAHLKHTGFCITYLSLPYDYVFSREVHLVFESIPHSETSIYISLLSVRTSQDFRGCFVVCR